MTEKRKSKYQYSYIINALFAAVIMIACLWGIGSLQRIRVVDDGFCYWGIAAYLSGYDWSELISASDYYSYGYSIILIPLFWLYRLGLSMTAVYRLAIVLNAFLLCGIYFMTLYMIKELFEDLPDILKQIISLFATLYIGNAVQMGFAWTEIFLCYVFWCVIVCLYWVVRKPDYKNLLGLIFSTAFLFAVHMRAVGVVIAVGMTLACFFIARRREINKKYIWYTLGIAVLLCFAVILMKNYVNDYIYLDNASGSVNNVQATIDRVGSLLSIRGIMDLAISVIGKIFYISSATFLFALVGVLAAGFHIVHSLKKNDETGNRAKWQFKEWMIVFLLLAFLGEVGVESIFKCQSFLRTAGAVGLVDTLVFGRYADFVLGPMLILGAWAVYHLKEHYKAILFSLLIAIGSAGVVQLGYNVLAFRKGTQTVAFRPLSSPWLSILANGHKTDFACYVMLVSIGVLLLICTIRLLLTDQWQSYGIVLILLTAIWGFLGVKTGVEYTQSKISKEKTVDTVAEIIKAAGEETQIYLVGQPGAEVKILQWLLADRSIHVYNPDDMNDIDMTDAIILGNSEEIQTISKLEDRFDFLYDSGYISVFIDSKNKTYEEISAKAAEMTQVSDPTVHSIGLSNVVTPLSYTKMNGSLYYNYEAADGGYMTKEMGIMPDDGIYEFTIDMQVRDCVPDTEIGYITVGDVSGNVQYTQVLYANDFMENSRRNVSVLAKIQDWCEPVIGIYTYGKASIRIYDISYQKKVGNIQLDSEEIADIAGFLEGQDDREIYYIDSDNSGATGFPWWEYGKLNYLSGQMLIYKENFEDAYYIVEKTDETVVDFCKDNMQELMEMETYVVFVR